MKLDCKDCSFRFSDRELLPCASCANKKGSIEGEENK